MNTKIAFPQVISCVRLVFITVQFLDKGELFTVRFYRGEHY